METQNEYVPPPAFDDLTLVLSPHTRGRLRIEARCQQGQTAEFGKVQSLEACSHKTLALWHQSDDRAIGEDLRAAGTELCTHLFPGSVGQLLVSQKTAADLAERALRLRLCLDLTDPAVRPLLSLPWEALYSDLIGDHMAMDRGISLVHSPPVLGNVAMKPIEGKLRCLVVGSSPRGRFEDLDLATERRVLKKAAKEANGLEFEFSESSSLDDLRNDLLDGGFHVLHFLGHGFRRQSASGDRFGLVFEDEYLEPQEVDSTELARLTRRTGLQLVVLNACWTSHQSTRPDAQPFDGVAQGLVRAGIPAVVAMSRPISEAAAVDLAGTFYRRIGQRDCVEQAVTEGRLKMNRQSDGCPEWLTPSLFLRGAESRLFAPSQEMETPAPKTTVPSRKQRRSRLNIGRQEGNHNLIIVHDQEGRSEADIDASLDVDQLAGDHNVTIGTRIRSRRTTERGNE